MSAQLWIALSGLGVSAAAFLACLFLVPKKGAVLRRYILASSAFYLSGTVLILILTLAKPQLPVMFSWLSEILILTIHAAGTGLIVFVVKKFAAGSKPAAKVDQENKQETHPDEDDRPGTPE